MTNFDVSRRDVAVGRRGADCRRSAFAKAPMTNKPAPGFHRFKLGAFEVTVVSDGPLVMGPPNGDIVQGPVQGRDDPGPHAQLPADRKRRARPEHAGGQHRQAARAVRHRHRRGHQGVRPYSGRLLANLRAAGIDPSCDRRRRAHPRARRSLLRPDDRQGRAQFPQRQDLHGAGRVRFLDRRGQGRHQRHDEDDDRRRAQEPGAEPRPHRVRQGRPGVRARHHGDLDAGPHRRPHQLRHPVAGPEADQHRRRRAPSHRLAGKAEAAVRLRHRRRAGRRDAAEDVGHAGVRAHPDGRLSLSRSPASAMSASRATPIAISPRR